MTRTGSRFVDQKKGKLAKLAPIENRKVRFLDLLRQGLSISGAAKGVGRSREWARIERAKDKAFAAAWADAIEAGTDLLEDEARNRALKQSDRLLIILLKARRPHKYRENIRVELDDDPKNLTDEQLEAIVSGQMPRGVRVARSSVDGLVEESAGVAFRSDAAKEPNTAGKRGRRTDVKCDS